MARPRSGCNVGMRAAAALLCPLLALAACAPSVSRRVPPAAVAALPLERRLTLLDAENGLLAATDARDAQEERVQAAGEARHAAERRLREAENARDKGAVKEDTARAALAEAEARKTFAERDRELQKKRLELADAELLVADARFEESRAAEVEAASLPGAGGIHRSDYADQVAELEKSRARKAAEASAVQAQADAARAAWNAARASLAKLTFGAQGSVWVD